jgi:predicted dehydrogenase
MDRKDVSRRLFLKTGAALGAAAAFSGASRLFAAGSNELKIGLIGAGYRGTGAAMQSLVCSEYPVKLWAVGDVFGDKIEASLANLRAGEDKQSYDRTPFPPLGDKIDVPDERKFTGFDAYKGVIASGVNIVICACPPHFRARHLAAAVEAGKHAFIEKPVAVDPFTVRAVIEAAGKAKEKGLSIVAGTQRRHQKHYLEIMKRIQDGQIGDVVTAQAYWNMNYCYEHLIKNLQSQSPKYYRNFETQMHEQIRKWFIYDWTGGDHVCEQHVHNLDIVHWALGRNPANVVGMGGRQARKIGNIWDHFALEFEYDDGRRVATYCRQTDGCEPTRISERIVGTKGWAYLDGAVGYIEGEKHYKYGGPNPDPYVLEHKDLLDSIVNGNPINEGVQVAESTMMAVAGRMSAYTGRAMKWEWAMTKSQLRLGPEKYEFGDVALNPVPVPGQTQLI